MRTNDHAPEDGHETQTVGDEQPPTIGSPPARRSRPTLPRIAWRRSAATIVKVGIVVMVVSVALGGAAVVAASFYTQYGAVRNQPNADAWAGLSPRFAGQASCTACHEPEARAQDASAHVDVSCESCHGPAAAHAASDSAARAATLGKPPSEICVTCHAATPGRPRGFAQINPDHHFSGDECMRCHDSHSIVAVRPPTVSHPLAHLPECTTCHAPDGLKEIPTGHEAVIDEICLSCHGLGAGRGR